MTTHEAVERVPSECAVSTEPVRGEWARQFEPVVEALARQTAEGAHHGVAVCVLHQGSPVVDVWAGAWQRDTIAMGMSATKGVVAVALHVAMERHRVSYDSPIADIWPGFDPRPTIRHVLCHEAGIPHLRDRVERASGLIDSDGVVAACAALTPLWEPGTRNGYHLLTFGWVVGELVRLITGRTLDAFVRDELAQPLGLDGVFLGVPTGDRARVTPLLPSDRHLAFAGDGEPRGFLRRVAFGPNEIVRLVNSDAGLGACLPSFGGCFTARSLAVVWGAIERSLAQRGGDLLSHATALAMATPQNDRHDVVLKFRPRWTLGFMSGAGLGTPTTTAFGHLGLGGTIALADPSAELALAMVCDQLDGSGMLPRRTRDVVEAAYECLR